MVTIGCSDKFSTKICCALAIISLFVINLSACSHVAEESSKLSDETPPKTTLSVVQTDNGYEIALNCVDTGGSGCANTFYTLGDGNPDTLYSKPLSSVVEQSFTMYSTDLAGNQEATRKIDLSTIVVDPIVEPLSHIATIHWSNSSANQYNLYLCQEKNCKAPINVKTRSRVFL